MNNMLLAVIPSLRTGTGPFLQGLATALRWGSGAAAVAVVSAGCGGGDGGTMTAEAQAQRDQTVAVIQAQQSVPAQRAALVQPGSGTEDFEAGMGDWQNWGNAQVVAGAGTAGSSALQVGPGAGGAALRVPGVAGGTTYRLTAQVRVTDPPEGPAALGVDFYDASGARIIGTRALPNVTNTSFAPFTYDVEAPAGTAYALAWVWKNGATGFAYVDDVTFGPASAPPPPPPVEGNLLSNGGFEAGMAGWVDWGNTRIVSDPVNSGASALGVGPAAGGAGHNVDGIVPGTTYRLVAHGKVSDASEKVFVGVNFLDEGGALVGSAQFSTTSTSYTTLSGDVTAAADAVRAVVYVWKNAGSGTGTVDDFAFGAASGSTPPPPTGANLLLNGTFENGLASWVNWGNTTTSGQAAAGTSAAQVGTAAGGLGQSVTGIVPGNTYRVVAQVKASSADETGYLGLKFLDAAGNSLQDAVVPFSSTSYSSAQAELVAPPNASTALVFVWKNAGSGFAFVDQAELRGAAASPAVLADVSTNARHSVAVLNTGTRVAAWGDDTGVHAQRFDADGGLVGSALLIAPSGSLNGVAALSGGGYVVEYSQPGAVLVQLVSAAGALAGAPVTVRTQAQVEADNATLIDPTLGGGAGVYPLGGGGFAALSVEFHSVRLRYDVPINHVAQRFDASGNVVGARMVWEAASFTASTPTGGLIRGREFVTWTPNAGRALIDVFDSALQRLTGYTSPFGEWTTAQGGAGLRNGSYIAIWTSGTAVRGQLFAPDADSPPNSRMLGPVVTFTNAGAGARVTGLAGGGFLLSWGTSAQAFDENAQPVSGVMQILAGSIAATPDGGFVVVAQVGSQLVEQSYRVGGGT